MHWCYMRQHIKYSYKHLVWTYDYCSNINQCRLWVWMVCTKTYQIYNSLNMHAIRWWVWMSRTRRLRENSLLVCWHWKGKPTEENVKSGKISNICRFLKNSGCYWGTRGSSGCGSNKKSRGRSLEEGEKLDSDIRKISNNWKPALVCW